MKYFVLITITLILYMSTAMTENAHDHSFKSINEEDIIKLSDYKGKTIVVVNTASLCGFTYQYEGLQDLYNTYSDRGLIIIGVPSNDFGNQESGDNAQVKEFCESTFNITFPLTEKNVVKGKNAHPFFQWSKKELGFIGGVPRWNFHKIIIDKNGKVFDTFASMTNPTSKKFIKSIEKALSQ